MAVPVKYQRFDYLPGFPNAPAETLLGHHLLAAGIETRLVPVQARRLISDLAIMHHDLSEEMAADAGEGGDITEIAPFLRACVAWATQQAAKPGSAMPTTSTVGMKRLIEILGGDGARPA